VLTVRASVTTDSRNSVAHELRRVAVPCAASSRRAYRRAQHTDRPQPRCKLAPRPSLHLCCKTSHALRPWPSRTPCEMPRPLAPARTAPNPQAASPLQAVSPPQAASPPQRQQKTPIIWATDGVNGGKSSLAIVLDWQDTRRPPHSQTCQISSGLPGAEALPAVSGCATGRGRWDGPR
jgi:hypothetical protein